MAAQVAANVAMHPCGKSKVEVYGWETHGSPGTFEWIPKTKLNVYRSGDFDDGYQRHRNDGWLNQLAKEWSWPACGALTVARRLDASNWVIDGSGRKFAADKRVDIASLPCMVYDMSSIMEEAKFFVAINTIRTGMKSLERFQGDLVSQDPVAVAVTKMVESGGYKMGRSGEFTVGCAMLLKQMHGEEPAICRTVWDLAVELHNGESINNRILAGMFLLEKFLQAKGDDKNHSLADPHNKAALLAAGPKKIVEKINATVALHGGGKKAFAYGIAMIINHKRTSRRIEFELAA